MNTHNKFNISRARDCAFILSGTHDFVAFRGAFRGNERGKIQNTICNVQNITIENEGEDFGQSFPSCSTYKVTITGDRFLYKMVRFLVGTIVQYGTNDEKSLQEVHHALSFGEWRSTNNSTSNVRLCAPANGLVLDHIDYGDKWRFTWMVNSI